MRQVALQPHALNAGVFALVLRGEGADDSDPDLLVEPMLETTLRDIGAIGYEIRRLLGPPVGVWITEALPTEKWCLAPFPLHLPA